MLHAPVGAVLLDGVVGGNREKIRGWLRPLNIRKRVRGVTKSRISVLALHDHLQVRRIPDFARDGDGLIVADFSGRNYASDASSLRTDAADSLRA